MFFGAPRAAFANIARALRGGGRLALLAWHSPSANEWVVELAAGRRLPAPAPGAPGPFALADPDYVRGLVTGPGSPASRLTRLAMGAARALVSLYICSII